MKARFLFVSFLIIMTLILVAITIPLAWCFNRTSPHTFLLDRDYSRLTKSEIRTRLAADFPLPQYLSFSLDSQTYQLPVASVSARLDSDKIVSSLLFDFLNHGPLHYLTYPYQPHTYPLDISYDHIALDSYLSDLSGQVSKPFVPTRFDLVDSSQGKALVVKTGEVGYSIDQPALKNAITAAFANYSLSQPLPIPLVPTGSLASESQVATALAQAQNLIGKTINLTGGSAPFILDDKTLISWVNIDNTTSYDQIRQFVASISQSLNQSPQDAVFDFQDGRVLEFQPSHPGLVVKEDELTALLISTLDSMLSDPRSLDLAIPFKQLDPQITTQSANDLGIRELLGRGTSTFKHSNATRNFNVEKGASIVNRILVPPGATFSFIENLGEVTVDAGFKKAYIIRQGRTELDVGGGICQVSTTLFRAMLNAGVNIIERQNHAYRVGYYEEDMPPGYDATVFIPKPDLRFVNDTGHYVLVRNLYDGVNKSLTYEIYGTSDGRRVEITNYRKWGAAPPPPARYIEDPTLPPGKVIKEETAVAGLKTAFDWTVTRGDEVLHQKTFTSNFVPWAAVYRRGPPQP